MFYFQLLRNQWVLYSILAGIVIMLLMIITYLDMWRPRKMKNDNPEETDTEYISMLGSIPWSLWIFYIVLTIWGLAYTVYLMINPPNW